jgi:hypothetical protein
MYTNQTTPTQTLPSPNAFISASNEPPNLHTQNHAWNLISKLETLSQEKKADYIHSQHAKKDGGRKNPDFSQQIRHVKTFFYTRIDLLAYILVTFATSHWFRSPLKTEAATNTITRRECWLHSQSTCKKEGGRKNPDHNFVTAQKKASILLQITYIAPQTQPPTEPLWITRARLSHVMSFRHAYRLDVMHAHKLFYLPTSQPPPQKLHSFPPPTNHSTYTHKTTQRPINHPSTSDKQSFNINHPSRSFNVQ